MKIVQVKPVFQPEVRALCTRPYPRHPRGCPNYGRKPLCPPVAPILTDIYDLSEPVWAIVGSFQLQDHVDRMKKLHPGWSEAQARSVLYWQPKARFELKKGIRKFLREHKGLFPLMIPEATGVNVTETLKPHITLPWPPTIVSYQVALVGYPHKRLKSHEGFCGNVFVTFKDAKKTLQTFWDL